MKWLAALVDVSVPAVVVVDILLLGVDPGLGTDTGEEADETVVVGHRPSVERVVMALRALDPGAEEHLGDVLAALADRLAKAAKESPAFVEQCAEVDAFGVSTEAGDGDIQKLHKSMMDAIRGLQSEDVAARARRLDLDDPRRTPPPDLLPHAVQLHAPDPGHEAQQLAACQLRDDRVKLGTVTDLGQNK